MDAREFFKLEYHLSYNAYPPVPAFAISEIAKAIDLVNEGKEDEQVYIPGLNSMPACDVVEAFHCEFFITAYDDDDIPMQECDNDWD